MIIDNPKNQNLRFIISNLYKRPNWFFTYTQETPYNKYAWLILYLAALGGQIENISSGKLSVETWSQLFFKVVIFVAGGSVLGYIILCYILSGISRWFKGAATAEDLLRVMSYATIPAIPLLLCFIIGYSQYGISFFNKSFWLNNDVNQSIYKTITMVVNTIAGINGLIFMVLGIAAVNNFQIWKAILTLILPFAIFIAIFLLLGGHLY